MNTKEYHYIEWYTWDHESGMHGEFKGAELYDKINDPYEKVNIAGHEALAETIQSLSIQLANDWPGNTL